MSGLVDKVPATETRPLKPTQEKVDANMGDKGEDGRLLVTDEFRCPQKGRDDGERDWYWDGRTAWYNTNAPEYPRWILKPEKDSAKEWPKFTVTKQRTTVWEWRSERESRAAYTNEWSAWCCGGATLGECLSRSEGTHSFISKDEVMTLMFGYKPPAKQGLIDRPVERCEVTVGEFGWLVYNRSGRECRLSFAPNDPDFISAEYEGGLHSGWPRLVEGMGISEKAARIPLAVKFAKGGATEWPKYTTQHNKVWRWWDEQRHNFLHSDGTERWGRDYFCPTSLTELLASTRPPTIINIDEVEAIIAERKPPAKQGLIDRPVERCEVKPCYGGRWTVYCNSCGRNDAEAYGNTREEAINNWNTRH